MDDAALLDLLGYLKQRDYRFHAATPATHARVLTREPAGAPDLRTVFGWNRPFRQSDVAPDLLGLMERAGIVQAEAAGLVSTLRVASLGEDLFLHSGYPTDAPDAVFFGPDTYRFARFLAQRWPAGEVRHIVDLGCGSGAGGVAAARLAPQARLALVDVNPAALRLARVNAQFAGVAAELRQQDSAPAGADLIVANPPYMMDDGGRAYRDGGKLLGGEVALQWARDGLGKLASGGTMLLYTGAAIVRGASPLEEALRAACQDAGARLEIEEIDPDVFGEELDQPAYREVERIAAIGAVIALGA